MVDGSTFFSFLSGRYFYFYFICYLCPEMVPLYLFRNSGLKGNRVEIPDSPAAVKLYSNVLANAIATGRWPGRRWDGSQSEDLPFIKGRFYSWDRKAVRKLFCNIIYY